MNQLKKVDPVPAAEARREDLHGVEEAVAPTAAGDEATDIETKRNPKRIVLMLAVPLLILLIGGWFWLNSGKSVSTDNAYVKQDITSISTQVSGPVVEVDVKENQDVKRGDVLFRVDPAPFHVALANAQAQLAAARLATVQLHTQAAGTSGDILGAQADLEIQQRALTRQAELLKQGFTTRSAYDSAVNEVQKAQTSLSDARARAANAAAAIVPGGDQPQVEAAQAAMAKAQLDLQHSTVRAPSDGVVAKADKLLVGQTAITGLSMLSIVRDKAAWVEANFKEGDLARMHVGLPATVKFDAYPGIKLKGHVGTIGSGTGSEFSVLPAQNANGNWVKVTQRVPVRIYFDEKPPRDMIAGLSAKVDVELAQTN
ncbi:MAG: HlyD family secretion protein [Pseudomonadota bacterium]|nr:HlyD family secretion protein [Pseudomonadota bacterium]